ncbi:hypothetical protein [Pedobacter sp. Leaf194]|uniref:hypothetical protein n=1 Tax=Pedobacter sp. Leaf194 TaxID=1736297 RepID=UPI00070348E7|nr:hypothetical protein [Pedobacter sp. Leaf194]KQS41148.1 hypothetical protein ASG14_01305 [Pedobacter sp. Leaf194]
MPDTKKRRYKILKWTTGILVSLFLILGGIAWLLNVKSRPILTDRIKTLLYKSTDSLYTISFTKVSTNILTGSATLQNVKISADTNRYKKLVSLKRAPNNLYTVTLKKLVVKNFHPLTLYREKKLQIGEILFDKPEVYMVNRQLDFNENRAPRPIQSPYTFISKSLKEFSIKKILFRDASFNYVNKNVNQFKVFSIDDLNITLVDLLVDSTSWEDSSRLYLLKDVLINLKNYSYKTPDSMYNIKLDQLDFKASTGLLNVSKFALEPRYDEMKFGEVAGFARDRFNIAMNNISLKGINLPLYISKQELRAKEMAIANGFVAVFNNNSLPKKEKENRIGKYPHQLLQKLGAPILIDKIRLKDININYALYNKESEQRGKISFEHTSGTVSNATNIEKVKATKPVMEANLTTYLMGQGKLDVDFKFNLAANTGDFSYRGELQNFNARVLNQITKPLGLVRINRGNVDKLQFDFKADDFGSKGTVNFSYFDLSVALMKNDPTKDHLVKRGLISFLANALIINSENPGPDGKFLSAKVNYVRPENTSFFNMIWKTLFIGVKYSVGITEEKQTEIKEHIAKFKAMRDSHNLRKKKRLERRQRKELKEKKERR